MIRFISNSITDQLGRSNFVDSNGSCVGLKEFPDGTPLLWATVPYISVSSETDPRLEMPPEINSIKPRCPLHSFLDNSPYIFGYVGVEKSPVDEGVEFAKIRLVRDDCDPNNCAGLILYVVISKADDLYFADFKFSIEDRKKLFGNVDSLKLKVEQAEHQISEILKTVGNLRLTINNLKTIIDVLQFEQKQSVSP